MPCRFLGRALRAPLRKYCCATLAYVFLRMYMYGRRSGNGFEDFSTLQFIIVVFLFFLLFRIFPLLRILEYSLYTIIYLFGTYFLEIHAFEEYYNESSKVD